MKLAKPTAQMSSEKPLPTGMFGGLHNWNSMPYHVLTATLAYEFKIWLSSHWSDKIYDIPT